MATSTFQLKSLSLRIATLSLQYESDYFLVIFVGGEERKPNKPEPLLKSIYDNDYYLIINHVIFIISRQKICPIFLPSASECDKLSNLLLLRGSQRALYKIQYYGQLIKLAFGRAKIYRANPLFRLYLGFSLPSPFVY